MRLTTNEGMREYVYKMEDSWIIVTVDRVYLSNTYALHVERANRLRNADIDIRFAGGFGNNIPITIGGM